MKKRSDGRYCKQVFVGYSSAGKRKFKTIYGKTIREVEKKEKEIQDKINGGVQIFDDITLGEWAEIWLKTYKTDACYNTMQRYKVIVDNQIKPSIGRFKLSDLKLRILQGYINELSTTYSQSTLKKIKITLNQICKCAITEGRLLNNPAQGLVIPKLNTDDITKTEDEKFIPDIYVSALNEFCKNYKHGSFIMTLLYTGIRRGEITALTWKDIDVVNRCIYINKAVEFIGNQPHLKAPKSKSGVRTIPLLDVLLPYLQQPANINDSDYVFKNSLNNMHSSTSLRRMFETFNDDFNKYLRVKKMKKTYITMHQFRHTYATMLYKAGVDLKTAQNYLGHSSVSVTMDIYTHLDKKHKQINADKLNAFICC